MNDVDCIPRRNIQQGQPFTAFFVELMPLLPTRVSVLLYFAQATARKPLVVDLVAVYPQHIDRATLYRLLRRIDASPPNKGASSPLFRGDREETTRRRSRRGVSSTY
jgi:hypothetical protein